jgi:hypothetical protein
MTWLNGDDVVGCLLIQNHMSIGTRLLAGAKGETVVRFFHVLIFAASPLLPSITDRLLRLSLAFRDADKKAEPRRQGSAKFTKR